LPAGLLQGLNGSFNADNTELPSNFSLHHSSRFWLCYIFSVAPVCGLAFELFSLLHIHLLSSIGGNIDLAGIVYDSCEVRRRKSRR
jgi:hypothetical protein